MQTPVFRVSTEWIVITGAPSSGKTSVIRDLAARGYDVQAEVARELIEECIAHGMTLPQIKQDGGAALQKEILRVKHHREAGLAPDTTAFMDRGMPDSVTYFRLAGMNTAIARQACLAFRYRAVFIFDRLPLVQDGVRTEDDTVATEIDRMLTEDYQSLGYTPVRVPVMPVAARTDFILKALQLPLQAHTVQASHVL